MLTLLFNLGTQPVSSTSYNDYMARCAQYAGYGYDSSRWTTAQTAELDRYVDEAKNYVLYPSTIPGERIGHTWSCMEQLGTVTTVAGTYEYSLPGDYGSPDGDMTFAAGTGFGPIQQTTEKIIRERRAYSSRSGRPEMFAIRWASQANGVSQFHKVQFYPTPSEAQTLTYPYAILMRKLSAANPYMPGGPRIEQLMIEACKAVGEASKNGARGDQWAIFIDRLFAAIQIDKGTNTDPTVGFMRGAREMQGVETIGTVSYWYGPSSTGAYTLET